MKEEKNNQAQNKKECPHCVVEPKTVEQLKQHSEKEKPKKKSRHQKALIFFGIIILSGLGWFGYSLVEQKENNKGFLSSLEKVTEATLSSSLDKPRVGFAAPAFTLEDVEGNRISLSDFQGKNVLVVFWATWCSYCKKELPDLKNFVQEYKDEIKVLAIDIREKKEVIRSYIKQNQINFTILLDQEGLVSNDYWVAGTPSHFLIDQEGKIVATWPGLALTKDLKNLAEKLSEK
ncbi:MAG TPA: TlpA family protein disulfide reductase [Candidatus Portnoybacteria bacterium]|nr:TlpA family protein disulfide reductase [Candidatus Portnoybacteria bacterium]